MQSYYSNKSNDLPYALKYLDQIEDTTPVQSEGKLESGEPQLEIELNDFDPAIKIGRDKKLFLKRKYIEMLTKETRYNEEDLQYLKDLYVSVAEIGKGLDLQRFNEFLGYIYNIENHLFLKRLFFYFDKNQDGLVEYYELVKSLDIIEKGNFNEKVEFCFSMYDPDNFGYLDAYAIKELFKLCYTNITSKLEKCIINIQKTGYQNSGGLTWEEFTNPKNGVMSTLTECLPPIFDRYDYKRTLIECLEKQYGFDLEKLEKFWKIYKAAMLGENESYARSNYATQLNILGPDYLTVNQFKLVMYDVFKIDNNQLLEEIFFSIDKDKEKCIKASEIVTDMLFFLRGSMKNKLLLFFEANSLNNGKYFIVPKAFLTHFLEGLVTFYTELYDSAREIANHMKSKEGKIYYEGFVEFCFQFPSAMDFIIRVTVGEHPQPNAFRDEPEFPERSYQPVQDEEFTGFGRAIPGVDVNELYRQNSLPSKRWLPRGIKKEF